MNAKQIEEGKVYEVKVGKNTTTMRVTKIEHRINGQVVFDCMNVKTNKRATVSDAKRFVKEIKDEKPKAVKAASETKGGKPKGQMSGVNAAYEVLRESGEAMNIKTIMEKINERGLAHLPGKTPGSTVSAAIQRDMKLKGEASRFVKVDKGMFAAR